MIDQILTALVFLAAVGSALIAGTFFAFSTFVMKALARLPARQGIEAMQSINIVVLNPIFLGVFTGTAVLSAILLALTFIQGSAEAGYLIAGSLVYLIGCFVVTAALNVPLNNRLAAVEAESAAGATLWQHYLHRWTQWNHLRTLGSLASFCCFIIAFP